MPGRNLLASENTGNKGRNLLADEVANGNPTSGQQKSGVQGQRDQLAMFGKLDKAIEGNPGRVYAAGGQITNATTFGAYDRLMAGVDQLHSRTQGENNRSYSDSLGDVRASRQGMRELHPVSSAVGDVTGLVVGGFGIDDMIRGGVDRGLAKLPQAKGALDKMGRYATRLGGLGLDGLAQYGTWTLGARAANKEAEEGRNVGAQERLGMLDPTEAAISAAAGPAMSGLYRGGRAVVTGRATPKNVPGGGGTAPALEEIQAMKSQAYQDAEALGVAYTPDAYAGMVAKIENVLEQKGADPQLNASVTSMLNAMQKRVGDQPITMQTIDKIRQQVRENVISPAHRAARDGDIRLGNIIIDEIDDFIASGVGAVSNNGQAGSAAIQKARALNSVWRKSQALQDAVENAQLRAASTGSGGNFENALRQEIRKIYQNPKKVAGFSKMERKAMKAVIEGDMGQNILRNIGKLSPQGNGLMAALGIGTTAANPIVAPIWLAGMGAKHLAQRGIKNKFDRLDEMVREGANNLPMKNITPPKTPPGGAVPPASSGPNLSPPARVTEQIPESAYNSRPGQMGLPMLNNPTVGGAVAGGMAGGTMAQDLDGDGRVSMQERYAQGSLGALGGAAGGRAIGKLDNRMISQGSRQVLEGRAMPNGAGSKGQLPMDEASRLARARELGFDTEQTLYHGTDKSFEAFAPEGRARHRNAVPNATYLSNLPDVAEAFTYGKEGAQTMPLYVRGKMKSVSLDDPTLESVSDFAAQAKSEGFAGIQLNYGEGSGGAIETIVFDPSNIRSKFAKFDSAQSESPVLTAGIGGRTRKDVMKDVMSESQGARVPGTSRPLPMKGKDAPAAPAYRDDLTTAAVVGLPVGGAAGAYAYSMYKAEMYKRGQKDIPSFQEFMRMIEQEQRSRMGVPPRPGLKPQDLPQRVQGQ
jgi:hypothetical protein